MSDKITHTGIIDTINGRHVRVRIVQQAACASCKVASHCNASDMKEKMVDAVTDSTNLSVGQQVVVSTSSVAVKQALLLAFGWPLLLLLCILAASRLCGCSEGLSAILTIGGLALYYIIMCFFRNRIAHSISFKIE